MDQRATHPRKLSLFEEIQNALMLKASRAMPRPRKTVSRSEKWLKQREQRLQKTVEYTPVVSTATQPRLFFMNNSDH